ncbi:pilus assembly protein Flp/PilA [Selenomonas sp. GACV-9]|uniref:Flp family type IVb pilin n=1 Tax=Selenomonas sp. GACV-9 TaxID=3158782 RepID=UPI0008DF4949|nr:pilus assembly protein Flp/PilA [Selenomonas ruminantium]
MLQRIEKKWSEKGQGIVEYALILAFVVAIAVIALKDNGTIGQAIQNLFQSTGQKIEQAGGSNSTTDNNNANTSNP